MQIYDKPRRTLNWPLIFTLGVFYSTVAIIAAMSL